MTSIQPPPLIRERNLILATLLILSTCAWALVIWQANMAGGSGMGLTMGMSAPLFMAIWIAMMVAMMFPAAAPMILVFARISAGKRQRGQPFVPAWVFVGAYLIVWAAAGVAAYFLAIGAERLAGQFPWLMNNAARIGGIVLLLAGAYQLSPLKRACLSKCRSPLDFILTSWRDGYGGAFRMGLQHGAYCLGCCWLLFVILFPLGVMNVAAMAVITLLVFAEKSLPGGRRMSEIVSAALIAYGALVVIMPRLLPTAM